MAEHRFSFTVAEMDTLRAVLDHALHQIDGRLGTTQTYFIDTTALRMARVDIVRVKSKLFPSVVPLTAAKARVS